MYEYKFVQCDPSLLKGSYTSASIQETIQMYAAEGWRLVQVLLLNPAAVPTKYEIILERLKT